MLIDKFHEQPALRSYWTPVTVLTTALQQFTLAISGRHIRLPAKERR